MEVRELLGRWGAFCRVHEKRHDSARGHFRVLNHTLMISSILFSSVSSALSLTVVSSGREDCNAQRNVTLIVLNSIGVLAATILSVHRFLGLSELQQNHDYYSDMYACLSKDIEMNLALEEGSNQVFRTLDECCKYCKNRIELYIDKAPAIPTFIVNRHPAPHPHLAQIASL